ncbi:MAG: 3-dehydroquinate synthase [Elusimicrobiota bacterium]
MTNKVVKLNLPASRGYDIIIGKNTLESLPCVLKNRSINRVTVITDGNVNKLYGKKVESALKTAGITGKSVIPAGEKYKNLDTIKKIYAFFAAHFVERRTAVIAVGGGVVGDTAGFAAATYLRGVPVIHVPTTLLAQVDSSVGGKTGVDLAVGKNLVGAFYQPAAVVADTEVLKTLPLRELRGGLAEVVKYGVLADAGLFRILELTIGKVMGYNSGVLEQIVYRCVKIKAGIVEKDEYERYGLRAKLNLGHTFGHAVETLTGYKKYTHGEAVAIGTVVAAKTAESMGYTVKGLAVRIERLLHAYGLPTSWPKELGVEAVISAMARDKKVSDGKIKAVLPTKIGNVITGIVIDKKILTRVLVPSR